MKKGYAVAVTLVMVGLGLAISGCLGPANNPPTAKISASKLLVEVGQNVTFNGSQSTDDKGIDKYSWDFGDGTTAEGESVTHAYSSSGKFTVKLTVTDGDGATGSDSVIITVSAPGARAVFDAFPPNAFVDEEITFDASRSENVSGIISFNWDFGDSQTGNGTSPTIKHSYSTTGTKHVTLYAEYPDGVESYSLDVGIYKTDPNIKNQSVFVTSTIGEPEYLDPAVDYETAGVEIISNAYETLVTYESDRADKFIPLLAESLPEVSADGTTYTFKLRHGVKFYGGREMKADDIIYSLSRPMIMADPSGPSWMMEQVLTNYAAWYVGGPIQDWIDSEKPPQYLIDTLGGKDPSQNMTNDDVVKIAMNGPFNKIDDYTVEIRLTHPYPGFVPILAFSVASIVDRDVIDAKCGAVAVGQKCDYMEKNAVAGTGPYVVKEGAWEPGSKITLDLNPNWWREAQQGFKRHITKVIIRKDQEYNTRLQLLKNGDADFAYIGWQNKGDVEGNPDLTIKKGMPTFTIMFYGMNQNIQNTSGMNIPADFFSDINVRKAFAYAWPYDDFVKNVLNGGGFPAQGPIPKGMFGYREDPSKMFTYDPAKAEEYFKKTPYWDSGFEITLYYNTGNDAREKGTNMFKNSLESLNSKFKVNVQGLDWPTYLQKLRNKEFPIFFLGWAPDYADPDDYVTPFLHSTKGYFPTRVSYANPQMDKLIEDAAVELDQKKREQLYFQIQDLEHQDVPFIWTYQATAFHVERAWVKGYIYNPMMFGGTYWAYLKGVE